MIANQNQTRLVRGIGSLLLIGLLLVSLGVMQVSAGNQTLSINSGSDNVRWFITGESTLVINGFDLDTFGVTRPTQVDRINLTVLKAVPGASVQAVVYQDANGGSPVDAKLVGRKTVDIQTAGVAAVTFDAPLSITDRFLWVGFYLPVGFEFAADASGTSTLTYWGWTANSTFDLANLSSAGVFGPSDGSAPVSFNLNGKARITAEIITGSSSSATNVPGVTPTAVTQIPGEAGTNLSPMTGYTDCGGLLFDRDDIAITYNGGVSFHCKIIPTPLKPESLEDYKREGLLYDVYVFGIASGTVKFPYPVTHCIKPPAADLNRALFGLGYGAPRTWEILPTVRFGDYICAEVWYSGNVSYFVPKQ